MQFLNNPSYFDNPIELYTYGDLVTNTSIVGYHTMWMEVDYDCLNGGTLIVHENSSIEAANHHNITILGKNCFCFSNILMSRNFSSSPKIPPQPNISFRKLV